MKLLEYCPVCGKKRRKYEQGSWMGNQFFHNGCRTTYEFQRGFREGVKHPQLTIPITRNRIYT